LAGAPKAEDAAAALKALVEATGRLAQTSREGERVLTRMGIDLATFVEAGRTAAAAWRFEELVLFADEIYEVDAAAMLDGCSGTEACTQAFVQAQQIVEHATLFGRVLIKAKEENRNAFGVQLERLDTAWRAYLSSSRGQYPWELALNSLLYRKTAAFDAPPTSQFIVLHPGAGYELATGTLTRQPSEVLFVELAGVYRWTWTSDARMRQRVGGSVALSWRDAGPDRRKLGYGALVYLPRAATVGYVWRPQDGRDEHALVLSADIVKFIRGTAGLKERLIGAAAQP
jgi:hypothetical protein